MLEPTSSNPSVSTQIVRRRDRRTQRAGSGGPEPASQPATRLKNHQIQYRRRKAAGLCTTTGCHTKAETGKARCRKHLRELSERKRVMCAGRARQKLCVECGKHPPFWGILCIVCRERRGSPVLPPAARKALKEFRHAEQVYALERSQIEVRFAVRKLLMSGEIKGNRERALRLYTGVDDNRWRSYSEVAKIMKLSKEGVRKLLLPSKLMLERIQRDNVPWKLLEQPARPNSG